MKALYSENGQHSEINEMDFILTNHASPMSMTLSLFGICAADISPDLVKLASRLMEVPGNSVPGKQFKK